MKKEEKWTPHIIAVMAFVVFIVLGLACASTPKSSNSIDDLKGYFQHGYEPYLVIFMENNTKVLFHNFAARWFGVYSTLDGTKLPSNLGATAYGGIEFPKEHCIILFLDSGIVKYDTSSIIYNERLAFAGIRRDKRIVQGTISHSAQSSAFRQRTVIGEQFAKWEEDEERNKIYFVDFVSMEITYITVDAKYDDKIYGYDDKNRKIILSKEEGKFDVLSTETGEVLLSIDSLRTILSGNRRWTVSVGCNNSDGFPKFDAFAFSKFSNPQFNYDGTRVLSILGHRIASEEEERENVRLIREYERRLESWKNSVKLYNDNYLAYLLTNNFFYYQDRIPNPNDNPYGLLFLFAVPAQSNQRSYMLYEPPQPPRLELLGKQVYLIKVLNAEDGSLIKEIVTPHEVGSYAEDISSYYFEDETGSYVMLDIPLSSKRIGGWNYNDIGVWDIEKGELILTIPADEGINRLGRGWLRKRAITYDNENNCLMAISLDGTIKRWSIGGN